MKRSWSTVIAWLLLAAALLFLLWRKPLDPSSPVSSVPVPGVSDRLVRAPVQEVKLTAPDRSRGQSVPATERREQVLQEIQSAVITYAPEGVKPIAGHLLDSDPEIRDAARQGLVQLGESTAIPVLREAARQLDESEAKSCLEAAAFLELPSWSDTDEARALSAELSKPTPDP